MANKKGKERYSIEGCIGCGICVGSNSEVFKFNKKGLAEIDLDKADEESVIEVSNECPAGAIKINH